MAGATPKRRTIIAWILIPVLALVLPAAAYVGAFYGLYYGTLKRNAFPDGFFLVERGDFAHGSLMPDYYITDDRDAWPFTARQFCTFYQPLIWAHMKHARRTVDAHGKPFDLTHTREICVARGASADLLAGDLVINIVRNGPILIRMGYFEFRTVADFAQ
jgi:hypothetical protein